MTSPPLRPTSSTGETSIDKNASLFIAQLGDRDVLLGRGTGPNAHVGNKKFRELVNKHRRKYLDAVEAGQMELKQVVAHIISTVHDHGGRFVKVAGTMPVPLGEQLKSGGKRRRPIYSIISETDILFTKVKQAFRYSKRKMEEEDSSQTHEEEEEEGSKRSADSAREEDGSTSAVKPTPAAAAGSYSMPHRQSEPAFSSQLAAGALSEGAAKCRAEAFVQRPTVPATSAPLLPPLGLAAAPLASPSCLLNTSPGHSLLGLPSQNEEAISLWLSALASPAMFLSTATNSGAATSAAAMPTAPRLGLSGALDTLRQITTGNVGQPSPTLLTMQNGTPTGAIQNHGVFSVLDPSSVEARDELDRRLLLQNNSLLTPEVLQRLQERLALAAASHLEPYGNNTSTSHHPRLPGSSDDSAGKPPSEKWA